MSRCLSGLCVIVVSSAAAVGWAVARRHRMLMDGVPARRSPAWPGPVTAAPGALASTAAWNSQPPSPGAVPAPPGRPRGAARLLVGDDEALWPDHGDDAWW